MLNRNEMKRNVFVTLHIHIYIYMYMLAHFYESTTASKRVFIMMYVLA